MRVTEKNFSDILRSLGLSGGEDIAVAVSGGGDSLALALLLKDVCKGKLLALTVDHGLREGSAAEACRVGEILSAYGIAHRVLAWRGDKPQSHVQEKARAARYELLLDACKKENIGYLAVAHNAEDQAETFWMRLAHGSGLDGLAAMQAQKEIDGVRIIRPLLSCTRAELRDYCRARDVAWIEDPSNENAKFLRVRLRGFEDVLAQEGLTPERLGTTLRKLEESKQALQFFAAQAFAQAVTIHDEGYLSLDAQKLGAYPVDIRRRVLEKFLRFFGGGYPTPFEALEALRLETGRAEFAGQTLGGCEIFPVAGKIIFCREAAAVEPRQKAAAKIVWDKRFLLEDAAEDFDVGALGEEGCAWLRKQKTLPALFDRLPFKIKKTLPALWQGENLLRVPHLDWQAPQAPEILGKARFSLVLE